MAVVVNLFEKNCIISGIGLSRIGRHTGATARELTVEAARQAISDAGLTEADIDGIATLDNPSVDEAAAWLGIEAADRSWGFDTAGLLTPLMSAMRAVGDGASRHVLVFRTIQMMGGSVTSPMAGPRRRSALTDPPAEIVAAGQRRPPTADLKTLVAAHAYSASNWAALHCRRHMHLYGTTKEQLGWVALNARRNAQLNPDAVYRDPMTMDDYLNARPISDPFGLYDCDVPVDGSAAFIISHRSYADQCPSAPVSVEAIGGSYGSGGWVHRPDYPEMGADDAAAQMWSRTDLRPADLDFAQLYDGFTFMTLAWLEAMGICARGESGPFVEGGERIARTGELPLNTYGGQLSAGRMHGYWVLHEACLQLRGQAGHRQVDNHHVAAVGAGGGPIAGCLILTA